MKINTEKALDILLSELYFKEFEIIDGLSQHPQGINYYQWLYNKGLISKVDLDIELDKVEDVEIQ